MSIYVEFHLKSGQTNSWDLANRRPSLARHHLISIAISVVSEHEAGEDFTPAVLRDALFARIIDLDRSTGGGEWLEAVGLPRESFEVDPVKVAATTARPVG